MDISQDVKCLKGVGPKLLEKLNKCGIFSILDLLLYFPRDYEFLRSNIPFNEIDEEDKQVLSCICVGIDRDVRTKTGKVLTTIRLNYLGNLVLAKWFNQGFIKNTFKIGQSYDLMGKFKRVANRLEVINPIIGVKLAKENEIVPKYSLKGELSDKILIKLIGNCLEQITINDNLPKYLLEKYKMTSLDFAIKNIHFPSGKRELELAINRLKFQELFTYSMKLLMLKKNLRTKNGIEFKLVDELRELKMALPYSLTEAQTRVVREILRDQKSPWPMNRLVQGDVGSGKTIVAFITMYINYLGGYQSALMAPTEILAQQHYQNSKELFKKYNIDIALLTGKTKTKEKKEIYEKLKNGTIDFIIGTHALFTDDVIYKNLGLVLTDEQHRFGVNQRSNLKNKGTTPDILYMSATPIPRTYALTLYGDMDVSNIKTLPSGKKEIITTLKTEKEIKDVLTSMYNELKQRHQIYVVAPLIEESDKIDLKNVYDLEEKFNKAFGKICNIDILHGKMKPSEKEEVMQKFKENKINILISTTVIEVGVDVKNATMMVIFDAERFGLSALHQLRGRVGRNNLQSYCILISNYEKERLNVLTKTNDGFKVSEEDFLLRGSGDIFGLRQSGDMIFKMADLKQDFNILLKAKEDSEYLLKNLTKIDPKEQQKYLNLITKATNLD